MSASTGSLSSNILFIRLELEQVQPGNRVIRTVYRSVQNIDHHLAGGADHCPVQMSAEHLALVVPGAHVQVGVKFTVHGVDGAGQRNDLKAAAEGVGVVFLFRHIVHAHRKAVGGTQRLNGGEADVFLQRKLLYFFKDLLSLSMRTMILLPKRLYSIVKRLLLCIFMICLLSGTSAQTGIFKLVFANNL